MRPKSARSRFQLQNSAISPRITGWQTRSVINGLVAVVIEGKMKILPVGTDETVGVVEPPTFID